MQLQGATVQGIEISGSTVLQQPSVLGPVTSVSDLDPYTSDLQSWSFVPSSSSYLEITPAAVGDRLAIGTGDFTMEFWCRVTDLGSGTLMQYTQSPGAPSWFSVGISGGTVAWGIYPFRTLAQTGMPYQTWRHVVLQRRSGTAEAYLQGTQIATAELTDSIPGSDYFSMGNTYGFRNSPAYAEITDARFTLGLAVYSAGYTPPDSPLLVFDRANPAGGTGTQAVPAGACQILLRP